MLLLIMRDHIKEQFAKQSKQSETIVTTRNKLQLYYKHGRNVKIVKNSRKMVSALCKRQSMILPFR